MANAITVKNLQAVVDRINKATGSPDETRTGTVANIGVVNTGGGIRDISNSGYMSKRALYDLMHAYLAGYEAGKGGV